ncbi:CapA family protein [Vaginisenegalia massiliensis]|uniref:CapA family protein n=1 Tax=Vaginisenegalia massiliensis TaxID=2058294 RepID=UPI000F53FBE5|nr:CapA family protein [Vaginisenegalia massiliensis]
MKQKYIWFGLILTLIMGLTASVYYVYFQTHDSQQHQTQEAASRQQKKTAEETKTRAIKYLPQPLVGLKAKPNFQASPAQPNRLVLRSVGDILIHDNVAQMVHKDNPLYQAMIESNRQRQMPIKVGTDYEFDFLPMFQEVAPFTSYADLTIANMEVLAASPQLPIAGYPRFSAPREVLDALKYIGVDIVSNATNHTMDWDSVGCHASIDNIKASGLDYVGSYESEKDKSRARIKEVNGIKVGFLAYTYGTNGIPVPSGEDYLVSLIDLPVMLKEIEALNKQVDATVVSVQLGEEYGTMPNQEQLTLYQALSEAGVDVILGGHPHVVQPCEWINDHKTFVIYSQASFISGQESIDNKFGGITEVTLVKGKDGKVKVTSPKFMPIFILGMTGTKIFQSVPLADYLRYQVPQGQYQWQMIKDRMQSLSTDYEYVTHLQTQYTQEDQDLFREE